MAKKEAIKEIDLGVIVKRHPSGMYETDKGEKSFQGSLGDRLVKRGRDVVIVPKGEKLKKGKESEEVVEMADPEVLTEEGAE